MIEREHQFAFLLHRTNRNPFHHLLLIHSPLQRDAADIVPSKGPQRPQHGGKRNINSNPGREFREMAHGSFACPPRTRTSMISLLEASTSYEEFPESNQVKCNVRVPRLRTFFSERQAAAISFAGALFFEL